MPDECELPPDRIVIERGNLKIKCGDCGVALYQMEVGGEIYGSFVDYVTKDRGQINVMYCGECWDNLIKNVDGPMRTAIARRRVLESITKEDEKTIEDKKNENC
jgi:hypothetical protein